MSRALLGKALVAGAIALPNEHLLAFCVAYFMCFLGLLLMFPEDDLL